jgi:adenosylcobinamide amidohydrolase
VPSPIQPVPKDDIAASVAPAAAALTITLARPWLVVDLLQEHEVASWAIVNGGRRRARQVAWLKVDNADLPPAVDPRRLLAERLADRGMADAVGLLTSGWIENYSQARVSCGDVEAHAVATVGLSNALAIGDLPGRGPVAGTINIVCRLSAPLTEEAALEALSLAAEARTAAVAEANVPSRRSHAPATGTGTDCIVLAWPRAARAEEYAGKHTAIGHVVGAAVLGSVRTGVATWLAVQRRAARTGL